MHHCIKGSSGIAKWRGIPMKTLIELVLAKAEAKVVAFFSFEEALCGAAYYRTQRLEHVLKDDSWRLHPATGNSSSLHCDDRSLPSRAPCSR